MDYLKLEAKYDGMSLEDLKIEAKLLTVRLRKQRTKKRKLDQDFADAKKTLRMQHGDQYWRLKECDSLKSQYYGSPIHKTIENLEVLLWIIKRTTSDRLRVQRHARSENRPSLPNSYGHSIYSSAGVIDFTFEYPIMLSRHELDSIMSSEDVDYLQTDAEYPVYNSYKIKTSKAG